MTATSVRADYRGVRVNVDYAMSIEEAISSCGFEEVYGEFSSKGFPSLQHGQRDVRLVLFRPEENLSFAEVVQQISHQGYRSGNVQELLAFAERCKNINLNFPVIAPFVYYRGDFEPFITSLPSGTTDMSLGLVEANAEKVFQSICRWLVVEK